MSIKYKCHRCDVFDTKHYSDIKKHFNRKHPCKKIDKYMFLSDDQALILSLMQYYDNIHVISMNDIEHLSSNIMDKNKNELFKELDNSEKNKSKICKYCNNEFPLLMEMKKHIILDCFYNELLKREEDKNKKETQISTNNSYNNCINSNSINTLNNVNNNNNNITNNIFLDINRPISFDKEWDISKISKSERTDIIGSTYMYTTLLEEILKNDLNLNVIIDKDKDSGMVYKDNKYTYMNIKDIVANTMEKLNSQLIDINKGQTHLYQEIINFTRQMINKKYIDFNKDTNIQEGVKNCISNIYENKKTDALNMAKNTYDKNKIIFNGF
jgi:hypothetical protein